MITVNAGPIGLARVTAYRAVDHLQDAAFVNNATRMALRRITTDRAFKNVERRARPVVYPADGIGRVIVGNAAAADRHRPIISIENRTAEISSATGDVTEV